MRWSILIYHIWIDFSLYSFLGSFLVIGFTLLIATWLCYNHELNQMKKTNLATFKLFRMAGNSGPPCRGSWMTALLRDLDLGEMRQMKIYFSPLWLARKKQMNFGWKFRHVSKFREIFTNLFVGWIRSQMQWCVLVTCTNDVVKQSGWAFYRDCCYSKKSMTS